MNQELVLNLWAIYDGTTGYIYGLAGKAYSVLGSDEQKLAVLQALSMTDYVTAKRYRVPDKFTLSFTDGSTQKGMAPVSAMNNPDMQLFEDLFLNIQRDLPPIPRFSAEGFEAEAQLLPKDPLCVTTLLYEDMAGNIRPIVTEEDRYWFRQQELILHGFASR